MGMYIVKQTSTFSAWMRGLRDQRAKRKIAVRLQQLKFGHSGDVGPAGKGLSELRIHEGKGYRVYFRKQGGGDLPPAVRRGMKSQSKDIAEAHRIWKEMEDEA